MQRLLNEPTLIAGTLRQVILAFVALGLDLSSEQIVAIMLAVESVLTLINRTLVTPNQLAEHRVDLGFRPTEKINS